MRCGGLQRFSLADFPGTDAAIIFTAGCNLRCPYCHNPDLVVDGGQAAVDETTVWRFLERRRGILDAVVLSGGEALLQPDIAAVCRRLRDLGYRIKLDTNGTRPQALADLLDGGLLDYVALDIKLPLDRYHEIGGDGRAVSDSLDILVAAGVAGECRSTVVHPLLDADDVIAIGGVIAKRLPWILQDYRPPPRCLDATFATTARAFDDAQRADLWRQLDILGLCCRWRGEEIRPEAPPSVRINVPARPAVRNVH